MEEESVPGADLRNVKLLEGDDSGMFERKSEC